MKTFLTHHFSPSKRLSRKYPFCFCTKGVFISCCLLIGLLLAPKRVFAQISLVKDINNTPIANSFQPKELIQIDGITYFSAETTENGRELWRSDGTEQGTYVIKDINPGPGSSSPAKLVNVNGTLYFAANQKSIKQDFYSYSGSYELWKSDGTLAGTVKVRDVSLGSTDLESSGGGLVPIILYGFNNTLIFSSGYDASYYFLYAINATSTEQITSIGSNQYNGPSFTVANNTLYFRKGAELWKSNGTAAGTVLVKSSNGIWEDYAYIEDLTDVNGSLYFSAFTDTNGRELWKSDGTPTGTVMVKDINPGNNSAYPYNLTNINGTLYFSVNDGTNGTELWKSNGTAAGTVMVKDIIAGSMGSSPADLTNVNGTLYFSASNGSNGRELWKSNGTAAGTVMVKDIITGSMGSSPANLTNVNNTLFFWVKNAGQIELWKSNGTDATTQLVKAILPVENGSPGASLSNFVNGKGTLFFIAVSSNGGITKLWKSNGTAEGTVEIQKNIPPVSASSYPYNITNVNGTLYFSLLTEYSQLWKSDGTAAGTVLVKDIFPGSNHTAKLSYLTNVNGVLYFTADNGANGRELWKSDGTAAGTIQVKDIIAGSMGSSPEDLTNVNGVLYFTADNGANGRELWKSDGTATGTVIVKDIIAGSESSYPADLTNVNGTLYFLAQNSSYQRELWKSNGTAAGTVMIKLINNHIARIVSVNEKAYFFTVIGSGDYYENTSVEVALWISNGTAEGTGVVKNGFVVNESDIYNVSVDAAAVGNILLFKAHNGKLWRSDGTTTGTVLVSQMEVSAGSSSPETFATIGTTAYFSAFEGKTGSELWKYNPTSCISPTKTGLEVLGNSTCAGKDGKITIKGSESGISYQAYMNNAALGAPVTGNGSDISLTIPAVSLSVGENKFIIQASGCYLAALTNTATINVSKTCPPSISVTSLTLINADTDQDIKTIANGDVIDYAALGTKNINIRANTSPSTVGSVVFELNGSVLRTESAIPYAMGGDTGPGKYNAWTLAVGKHSLKATPYSANSATGTAGEALEVSVTVVEGPTVLSYTLINANTDKDIREIKSGEVIDYSKLGTKNINIRANTYPATVGSVVFSLHGKTVRTENIAPYALGGDNYPTTSDYKAYPLAIGSYTLKATPYSARSAAGTAGTALTVSFTVVSGTDARLGQEAQAAVSAYPNPFTDKVTLEAGEESGKVRIELVDASGKLQHKALVNLQAGRGELTLPARLKTGVYFMLVVAEGKDPQVIKLIKQ